MQELNDQQKTIVALQAGLFLSLRVRKVYLGACPECLTPVMVEDKHNDFCCGYCGAGPLPYVQAHQAVTRTPAAAGHL